MNWVWSVPSSVFVGTMSLKWHLRPFDCCLFCIFALLCLEELTWKAFWQCWNKTPIRRKIKKIAVFFFSLLYNLKMYFETFSSIFSFFLFVLHLAGMGMFYILASSLIIPLFVKHVDPNYLLLYISRVLLHVLVKYLLKWNTVYHWILQLVLLLTQIGNHLCLNPSLLYWLNSGLHGVVPAEWSTR